MNVQRKARVKRRDVTKTRGGMRHRRMTCPGPAGTVKGMELPESVSWTPQDEAELTAAWRLWLELNLRVWPGPGWSGSPAEAVRPLRELVTSCDTIHADYATQAGSRAPRAALVRLLQSLVFVASIPLGLWGDDTSPLDAERAALLHTDLAGFDEYARGVRAVLARGGGWAHVDTDLYS